MLMLGNAIKHIERLPEPGEYLHCVINGSYDPWFVVPAVLRLAAPATIAHLWVATLGYNRTNILNMVQLLDAKAIARVSLICSLYFRSVERDIWDELYNGLTSRGQRVVSVRSHCKILGFEMSDGRRFLSQGSANLRSSSNLEQFVMTQDGELLAFHTAWMDDVIKGAAIE
jgi:hypothetical protein